MPIKIDTPAVLTAAGNVPKQIQEFIGRVRTDTPEISVAMMKSPGGWEEPGQQPEFNEYTIVLQGVLRVKTREAEFDVRQGEALIAEAGAWVKYSTPEPEGAEYIAICSPAFAPHLVNRDPN
jgi:mannose-6-phosphate isomerase-like protein (cupin superfamily)